MQRQPLLVTPEQERAISTMLRQWEGADPRAILKHPGGFTVKTQLPPPPPPSAGAGGASVFLTYIDSERTMGECYKLWIPNITATAIDTSSGTMSLATFGNIVNATEATLWNTARGFGATTHVITVSPQRVRLVVALKMPFIDSAHNCPFFFGQVVDSQSGCIT